MRKIIIKKIIIVCLLFVISLLIIPNVKAATLEIENSNNPYYYRVWENDGTRWAWWIK